MGFNRLSMGNMGASWPLRLAAATGSDGPSAQLHGGFGTDSHLDLGRARWYAGVSDGYWGAEAATAGATVSSVTGSGDSVGSAEGTGSSFSDAGTTAAVATTEAVL